jgi:hypothetical protein
LESELGLQLLDSSGQVPDLQEPPRIDGAGIKNVFPIHVAEARGSQIQSAARNDAVLNRHVVKMVFFKDRRLI